jgi:hypothetical protein
VLEASEQGECNWSVFKPKRETNGSAEMPLQNAKRQTKTCTSARRRRPSMSPDLVHQVDFHCLQ